MVDVTGSSLSFDSAMRFQTHDADECKEYFRAQQGTHQFDLSRGPSFQGFQHHEWPVGRLSLNLIEMRCAGDFTVTKAQPASYYQFNFLLEGSCRVKGRFGNVIAQPGDAFVIDPDQPLTETTAPTGSESLRQPWRNRPFGAPPSTWYTKLVPSGCFTST